ncbi:response regulator [Nostoc sp. FACHB-152]|nr:response regulator [Nostoc sp. FACHB-152]MBD2466732.1 response regulator [Nostoc sp. FACHB-145]
MKILCIEDDESLATLLQKILVKQHYHVEIATDGQAGWELAQIFIYDLILLDWILPKLTGIEFCQKLRDKNHSRHNPNHDTPVLLMTALDATTSKVMALDAGADDYVVKPFDFDELLARIRALLRRKHGERSPILKWGELCLSPNSCEVTYREQPIALNKKEYELLELFLRNPEQSFSIRRLLDCLWPSDESPTEGAVRAQIKGLRQKLKQAGVVDPLETIYKIGYKLKTHDKTEESYQDQDLLLPVSSFSSVTPDLSGVWQECRQSYCDRLFVIQQAVTALQSGTLTPEQQHQAEREAHTLVGSLGSFGLDEASQISRQIQQILKQPHPPSVSDIEALIKLIAALGGYLETESSADATALPSSATIVAPLPLKLLVVDDDLALAQQIAQEASNWGMQAQVVTTIDKAEKFLNDFSCQAILLDLNILGSVKTGLEFLATISRQYSNIPVIILTAEGIFEKRVEAARLGSRCFLQKPLAPYRVLAAVAQVLEQTIRSIARILILDDDPALLRLLSTLMEPYGYDVILLSEAQQFWQTLEQKDPDLLILDIELYESATSSYPGEKLPHYSGIELCQVIRSDLRWNCLPVIFLSAHTDLETVQRSFVAGADDFLNKPVVPQELLTRVQTRLKQRKMWATRELDELTGLCLRRKALQDLTRSLYLAQRQQQPFSLAILDLDKFKQVNDQYGHDMGDRVLNYIGNLLNQSFRGEDIIGRWGGEEFVVGMYGMTKQNGIKRLNNLLKTLNSHVFVAPNGTSFQVTFSGGIAESGENGTDLQTLYNAADEALYRAKAAGRNRILAAPTDTVSL